MREFLGSDNLSREAWRAFGSVSLFSALFRSGLTLFCANGTLPKRFDSPLTDSFQWPEFTLTIYRYLIFLAGDTRSACRLAGRIELGILATHAQTAYHPVVLLVEDLESLRQRIQEILEDAEFLVLPAANAQEALELAQSCAGPINLLITELHPAGMPGPDLASHLRKRSPQMSVLYSSANPLAALEIPDPAEVVSSIIPRPFSKTRLLGRVKALLAAHN